MMYSEYKKLTWHEQNALNSLLDLCPNHPSLIVQAIVISIREGDELYPKDVSAETFREILSEIRQMIHDNEDAMLEQIGANAVNAVKATGCVCEGYCYHQATI